MPFERILAPLDGSETSARALPLVAELARAYGSEVLLLHVLEGKETPQEALAALEKFKGRLEGVKVRTGIAKSPAALGILDAAKDEKADLVAMTTHGRTGPSRWAFGSTAEAVLRECATPLLVVRAS